MKSSTLFKVLFYTAVATVLGACAEQEAEKKGLSLELSACTREPQAPPPVVNGAECGQLSVPLDYQQDDGETISLAIKRWPAISAAAEPDPVFIIAGGPGQSAIDVSDRLLPVFFNLRKKRDIVFVDQRGTGGSSPLHCELKQNLSLAQLSADSEAETLNELQACAQQHSQRAPFMLTAEAVTDLDEVRKALGYRQINVWGGSYGTRVALRYMAKYPHNLRAAVLDGLAPATMSVPYVIGAGANHALATVSDECLARHDCGSRYGNIERQAKEVGQRLLADPVTLSIPNPLTAEPETILLDAKKFAALVRMALYDRIMSRLLPFTIHAAAAGDYQPVAALVSQFLVDESQLNIAMGMHLSIMCNEDAGVTPLPEREDFLGVDLAATMLQACEFWPAAEVSDDYYTPVISDAPVLLLSGRADPVTPPKWGTQVAESLTNATHLVATGAHHGVTLQTCAGSVVTEFIRDLAVGERSVKCMDAIVPMPSFLHGVSND
ncbi:alpha/beta hydrolase [Gilvimarinus sp. DA14]|uniref:alpha/beta hydrolase n=1 Tax=Gilvimarinus sp. DA14 TaxID=2956798 RepID=UPI0020B63899|nr:alpha/beta hydrolase [Gilvimarinus sp. DA14]UTF61301.1 alpha/beta hydrolase [Gilvimarinus sp. DA14]